jgi:hypothetical protein
MSTNHFGQPDGLAKGVSHVVVGLLGVALASYVLVKVLGLPKASPTYQLLAAAGAIWLHYELDMPVAKQLSAAGL